MPSATVILSERQQVELLAIYRALEHPSLKENQNRFISLAGAPIRRKIRRSIKHVEADAITLRPQLTTLEQPFTPQPNQLPDQHITVTDPTLDTIFHQSYLILPSETPGSKAFDIVIISPTESKAYGELTGGPILGKGGFARVKSGIFVGYDSQIFDKPTLTGQRVALKIEKDTRSRRQDYGASQELRLLNKMGLSVTKTLFFRLSSTSSPFYRPPQLDIRYRVRKWLMVMPLIDGVTLIKLFSDTHSKTTHGQLNLRAIRKLPASTLIRNLCLPIIDAVAAIHHQEIVHRDLNLKNILVHWQDINHPATITVIDFADGADLTADKETIRKTNSRISGCASYHAPAIQQALAHTHMPEEGLPFDKSTDCVALYTILHLILGHVVGIKAMPYPKNSIGDRLISMPRKLTAKQQLLVTIDSQLAESVDGFMKSQTMHAAQASAGAAASTAAHGSAAPSAIFTPWTWTTAQPPAPLQQVRAELEGLADYLANAEAELGLLEKKAHLFILEQRCHLESVRSQLNTVTNTLSRCLKDTVLGTEFTQRMRDFQQIKDCFEGPLAFTVYGYLTLRSQLIGYAQQINGYSQAIIADANQSHWQNAKRISEAQLTKLNQMPATMADLAGAVRARESSREEVVAGQWQRFCCWLGGGLEAPPPRQNPLSRPLIQKPASTATAKPSSGAQVGTKPASSAQPPAEKAAARSGAGC